MARYYCAYCNVNLTHSSPTGRKQHNNGRKHIYNKVEYYRSKLQIFVYIHNTGLILSSDFVAPSHIDQKVFVKISYWSKTDLNYFVGQTIPANKLQIPKRTGAINTIVETNLNTLKNSSTQNINQNNTNQVSKQKNGNNDYGFVLPAPPK